MSKAKSPLTLTVRGLTDAGITFTEEVTAAELDIADDDRVCVAAPFRIRIHAGTVGANILCQGAATAHLRCRCDRCLAFYPCALPDIEICHLYESPDEDVIDLTEDVREDILLVFPQWTLCAEDCRGLCRVCGQNLNVRQCGCRQDADSASPWGALNRLNLPGSGQNKG